MEIFINEQKIDFQLENETYLFEIIEGINSWAAGEDFYVQSILFDKQIYSADDLKCRKTPVETVKKLEITAKNRFEIHEDNLQLLYQYISLMIKSMEGRNIKLIKELQADADSVTRLLSDFLGERRDGEESISRSLYETLMVLNPGAIDENSDQFTALINQLLNLKIILNERILELTNPLGELKKTTKAMKVSAAEINDISILLQSGKDREALNCIIKFSELSQKTLRIYPLLKNSGIVNIEEISIDGLKFSDYYINLNSVLSELLEAFTANDSVLIGDLLEYEVAPRIESLVQALDSIQKE